MNWAQHIKIDYAPNLRKCLNNAKQTKHASLYFLNPIFTWAMAIPIK